MIFFLFFYFTFRLCLLIKIRVWFLHLDQRRVSDSIRFFLSYFLLKIYFILPHCQFLLSSFSIAFLDIIFSSFIVFKFFLCYFERINHIFFFLKFSFFAIIFILNHIFFFVIYCFRSLFCYLSTGSVWLVLCSQFWCSSYISIHPLFPRVS